MENWQSEFLQFFLFIGATVWLVQKGSNESKLRRRGPRASRHKKVGSYAPVTGPGWAKLGGLRQRIYQNSLLGVMLTIFLLPWFAQSITGWRTFNEDQREHGELSVWMDDLRAEAELLGEHPPELAVGVPGRRHDGRLHDLSAPAWLARVEASRRTPRRDSNLGLTAAPRPGVWRQPKRHPGFGIAFTAEMRSNARALAAAGVSRRAGIPLRRCCRRSSRGQAGSRSRPGRRERAEDLRQRA